MHHTSATNPTTLRIGILTAAAAISILAIGFAPVPHVFYWLGGSALASILTIATGPKHRDVALSVPIAGLLLVPALCTLLARGTSLIWAVAPVLAFVVAAVTWMVATNRYATIEADQTTTGTVTVSELPNTSRDEKAAATHDDTSATAA